MINNESKKPKTVYINLPKAARQKSEKNSPERSPDKFRLPLSKLKKTFAKTDNVFEKINENQQKTLESLR